ncbi:hypothetical protein T484DRAFT_1926853 [Baffinella frigidus]|nr:hypothetical protein T484DRAFT_1926853 [Cryptophyta sp. CCMP2293]
MTKASPLPRVEEVRNPNPQTPTLNHAHHASRITNHENLIPDQQTRNLKPRNMKHETRILPAVTLIPNQ